MADHYSDYLKKSVSASDLVFDKVQESDKDVIKRIKKSHIRSFFVEPVRLYFFRRTNFILASSPPPQHTNVT